MNTTATNLTCSQQQSDRASITIYEANHMTSVLEGIKRHFEIQHEPQARRNNIFSKITASLKGPSISEIVPSDSCEITFQDNGVSRPYAMNWSPQSEDHLMAVDGEKGIVFGIATNGKNYQFNSMNTIEPMNR